MFYNLNSNVKNLRTINKLTQKEMSEILELKLQSYKNFESGKVNISIEKIDILRMKFDINIHELIYN